jgi:hypothetical protein
MRELEQDGASSAERHDPLAAEVGESLRLGGALSHAVTVAGRPEGSAPVDPRMPVRRPHMPFGRRILPDETVEPLG